MSEAVWFNYDPRFLNRCHENKFIVSDGCRVVIGYIYHRCVLFDDVILGLDVIGKGAPWPTELQWTFLPEQNLREELE